MNIVRLCIITATGGALEFFDFTIFMLFSHYIAAAFFPESDPVAGMFSVALLFLTGYVARLLGGLVAGHYGDRYGRKKLFMVTIALMSLATLGIGLLPAYAQWGQWSLWLLTLLRLLQGCAVGGELPGSTTFAAEHVPRERRGLVTGIILAAVTLGNVFGASSGWLLNSALTTDEMYSWGWRIPFLFGGIFGVLGLLVRRKITETPVYLALSEKQRSNRLPLKQLICSAWRRAFTGVVYASVTATFVSVFLYLPGYLGLHSGSTGVSAFQLTTVGFLLYSVLTVPFAWLSDHIGRRRQLLAGAIILIPVSLIGCWLATDGSQSGTMALIIMMAISGAVVNGAYECAIIELFPTSIRYSGVAFSHNLSLAFFGGLTPVVLAGMEQTGIRLMPVLLLIPVSLLLLVVVVKQPCRSSEALECL